MPSHPEMQGAIRAALAGRAVPAGVTAVGDLARRFAVYRNNVVHSLVEALGQRFPAVRRIVCAPFFEAAARDFVRARPPETPVLLDYGGAFPDFLAAFGPAAGLPYLPDVARLEWLRGRAYHAADAASMTPAEVRQAAAAAGGDFGLRLHPALFVYSSGHPAVSIWEANQGAGRPRKIAPTPEAALVFRQADTVPVLPVPPRIAALVVALAHGAPLELLAQEAGRGAAAEALSVLVQNGLVVAVVPQPGPEEYP